MSLTKFESMLKTNSIYFFDLVEFEEIIIHYLDVGKHALAKKAVKLGLEQHPQSIDLKFLQVELYVFENELDKAALLLKRIEHIEPNNEEVFIQRATINSKSGNHKEAISNLKKALSFTDDKVDVWSLMGMEYLYLDDFKNARINFEKCIEEDLEDYSSLYNIVYCFDMEENHVDAITYLNTYVDKNPYCEIAWHQLGKQYSELGMHKKALRAFDFSVLIDESFIGGYLEKAKTLEELNKFEDAGMLSSSFKGNKKVFKANVEHPLFKEIHSIILKYIGIDQVIEKVIERLGSVEKVYLAGKFARGIDSKIIDLVFIGDIDKNYLVELVEKVEKVISKKVRYLVYLNENDDCIDWESFDSKPLLLWSE